MKQCLRRYLVSQGVLCFAEIECCHQVRHRNPDTVVRESTGWANPSAGKKKHTSQYAGRLEETHLPPSVTKNNVSRIYALRRLRGQAHVTIRYVHVRLRIVVWVTKHEPGGRSLQVERTVLFITDQMFGTITVPFGIK